MGPYRLYSGAVQLIISAPLAKATYHRGQLLTGKIHLREFEQPTVALFGYNLSRTNTLTAQYIQLEPNDLTFIPFHLPSLLPLSLIQSAKSFL